MTQLTGPQPVVDGELVSPDDAIWRYMSVGKYLDLLQTKRLFLPRIDRLGDEWECTWPQNSKIIALSKQVKGMSGLTQMMHEALFVSCWHRSTHESLAMWKQYAQTDEGVAVRTTVGLLLRQFANTTSNISYSPVRYVDFEKEAHESLNHLHLAFFKRSEFSHEREFRVVRWDQRLPLPDMESGRTQACNIHEIVQEVAIAPKAPAYLREVVTKVTEMHGVHVQVRQSHLAGNPHRL